MCRIRKCWRDTNHLSLFAIPGGRISTGFFHFIAVYVPRYFYGEMHLTGFPEFFSDIQYFGNAFHANAFPEYIRPVDFAVFRPRIFSRRSRAEFGPEFRLYDNVLCLTYTICNNVWRIIRDEIISGRQCILWYRYVQFICGLGDRYIFKLVRRGVVEIAKAQMCCLYVLFFGVISRD